MQSGFNPDNFREHMLPLPLRPHHGLCIGFFDGKGYDAIFTEHMRRCIAFLKQENPEIQLVVRTDVICACCPHHHNQFCDSDIKTQCYDSTVLQYCHLTENQILRWDAFQKAVYQNILVNYPVNRICRSCQWLFICEKKQEALLHVT